MLGRAAEQYKKHLLVPPADHFDYWHLLPVIPFHSFRDAVGGVGEGSGGGGGSQDAVAQIVAQSKWLHRLQLRQVSSSYGGNQAEK